MIPTMLTLRQRTVIHTGPVFSVERLTLDDETGQAVVRDIVRHPGAVTIVAIDESNRLAMVRNHRVAVGDWLLELPAGKLERGEDPSAAAVRELEEETGFTSHTISKLGTFYTSPGFADELMHVFEAKNLRWVGQRLEVGETIEKEMVAVDEIWDMIADGRLRDGKSIAALLLWRLRQEGMR